MAGRLILLGSGETSPSMVTFHQNTLQGIGKAAFLDSSFGFQANADDLSLKISSYFAESVGRDITPIQLRSTSSSSVEIANARKLISESEYVIAGPGSPTYALRVWQELNFRDDFLQLLENNVLVLASAAALTAGAFTIPVYEIYKVGETPCWREGLDIFGALTGITAAIVPHFNNAEGGRHDTRCCYIGESRLAVLEQQLPDDAVVIGIDEHTGVELDVEAQTLRVFGRGGMTLRHGGDESFYPAKSVISVAQMQKQGKPRPIEAIAPSSSRIAAELLAAGDIQGAVIAAIEDLDIDRLHAFIMQLAEKISEAPVYASSDALVDFIVHLRDQARNEKRWSDSDAIRDYLAQLGIEVTDAASGATWKRQA